MRCSCCPSNMAFFFSTQGVQSLDMLFMGFLKHGILNSPSKIAFLFSTTGVQALDVVFMLFLQTELGFFCSAAGIRAAGILLLNGGGTWHSASQWQACNLWM